jgi:hypothetical protein
MSSMPFKATLARYVADVAERLPFEINGFRVQLTSLHQISEEALVKLYEFPQASVADCDILQRRYDILHSTAAPMIECGNGQ